MDVDAHRPGASNQIQLPKMTGAGASAGFRPLLPFFPRDYFRTPRTLGPEGTKSKWLTTGLTGPSLLPGSTRFVDNVVLRVQQGIWPRMFADEL